MSSNSESYAVENILRKRRRRSDGQFEYQIKWLGYSSSENTWESEEDLIHDGLQDEIDAYNAKEEEEEKKKKKKRKSSKSSSSARKSRSRSKSKSAASEKKSRTKSRGKSPAAAKKSTAAKKKAGSKSKSKGASSRSKSKSKTASTGKGKKRASGKAKSTGSRGRARGRSKTRQPEEDDEQGDEENGDGDDDDEEEEEEEIFVARQIEFSPSSAKTPTSATSRSGDEEDQPSSSLFLPFFSFLLVAYLSGALSNAVASVAGERDILLPSGEKSEAASRAFEILLRVSSIVPPAAAAAMALLFSSSSSSSSSSEGGEEKRMCVGRLFACYGRGRHHLSLSLSLSLLLTSIYLFSLLSTRRSHRFPPRPSVVSTGSERASPSFSSGLLLPPFSRSSTTATSRVSYAFFFFLFFATLNLCSFSLFSPCNTHSPRVCTFVHHKHACVCLRSSIHIYI